MSFIFYFFLNQKGTAGRGEYALTEWIGAKKRNGVATLIRSRNHKNSVLHGRTNLLPKHVSGVYVWE